MTKEMFMELFGLTEDSDLMDCIYDTHPDEDIDWFEMAKIQIQAMAFLIKG